MVTWGAVLDLGWAIRGGVSAEIELLAGSVELQVVDGRGGADGHDAEGWVGCWLANWCRGGEEGEGEGGECELHCGFWWMLEVLNGVL